MTDPLGALMGLLNPENQQWLKSPTPQRQQELAQDFAYGNSGDVPAGT
ncbi:hypothetical protein [Streptomyces sp. NPDC055287]